MSEDPPFDHQQMPKGVDHGPYPTPDPIDQLQAHREASESAYEEGRITRDAADTLDQEVYEGMDEVYDARDTQAAARLARERLGIPYDESDDSGEVSASPEDLELASAALGRDIKAARESYDSAERSLKFTLGYSPSHPGPAPHPEAGGMDHEDWRAASAEYSSYDSEAEADEAGLRAEEAEDKYYSLLDVKEDLENGDQKLIAHYAAIERAHREKEAEKQRLEAEGRARWAKYEEGSVVEGSSELRDAIHNLKVNTFPPTAIRGKHSSSGWTYLGDSRYSRVTGVGTPEELHEKFNLGGGGEGEEFLQYVSTGSIDQEARRRYAKNIGTSEFYQMWIKPDGRVSKQDHRQGPVSQHMPFFMDNGYIKAYITTPPDYDYYAQLNPEDIAKMRGKVAEVTEAMKELSGQVKY